MSPLEHVIHQEIALTLKIIWMLCMNFFIKFQSFLVIVHSAIAARHHETPFHLEDAHVSGY